MTVNDLIRELSELSRIDRELEVLGVEHVKVSPGHYVDLCDFVDHLCEICGEEY